MSSRKPPPLGLPWRRGRATAIAFALVGFAGIAVGSAGATIILAAGVPARGWVDPITDISAVAVAGSAAFAAISGMRTLHQRAEADRRAHWWERATWAITVARGAHNPAGTASGDGTDREFALATLNHLIESGLSGPGEADILRIVLRRLSLDPLTHSGSGATQQED